MSTHIIIQSTRHQERPEAMEGVVEIVAADGRVRFHRERDGKRATLTLNPDLHFKPWAIGSIYYSAYGEFHYVDDLAENRDKDAFMRSQYACREGVLIEVGWGATPADCAVVSFVETLYEGTDALSIDRVDRTAGLVNDVIPGFAAQRLSYANARRELLKRISPLDSIGELEKQVDLLTGLVLQLMRQKSAKAGAPAWLAEFEKAIEQTSSVKGMTPEESIAAIKATKGNLREALASYHLNKKLQ